MVLLLMDTLSCNCFIDFDGDGIQDGDEPSGSTDANGNFSILQIKHINFRVVIKGVENVTIDQDNPDTAITLPLLFSHHQVNLVWLHL